MQLQEILLSNRLKGNLIQGSGDLQNGHLSKSEPPRLGQRQVFCYKYFYKQFAVVNGKRITKKARIEATVLNSLTPLSKAEICKILPDVSPTTVEAVLGAMVKTGSVKRIGASRAARYIKA